MTSSCKSLEVFDFKEEDELTELASSKLANKLKDPSAIDKYKFLEHVAQGTDFQAKEISNLPCVDVDEIDNDQNCENALSNIPFGMEGEDPATKQMCGLNDIVLFNSANHEQHTQFIPDKFEPGSFSAQLELEASKAGAASPGSKQLNCAHQESPSSDESVDVNPDADECMSESSSSTSLDTAGDDVPLDGHGHGPLSDHCFGSWEMGDGDMTIVCPDYIKYRGRYCTGCVLIFSRSCVELKGSTAYVDQETFSFQWGIDDIIKIESQWFERLETAEVKIRVIEDAMQAESVQATGVEELNFAINDFNWVEKQEEIMSLDVKYKAMWNVGISTDIGGDGEALPGQNGSCFPRRRYFPNFDEPFEEVIYPKGDSDAVSISKRDVDLLQPDTFVNDTIIDFYIKYLKNELQPDKRHRFHFFNSFFFRKLIDLDKDQSSAFESRAAFQRVRKWTRKVNLFEKDYIFIPVNFNYHWSLIVICHPGEIAKCQDEDLETTRKVPCILHMDSIKGTHTGLKNPVQSYLLEEWKEKQKEGSEDISSKFFNLRFVPLELPQQQNSFDCGLFLLHYVECFLAEAPLNFTPFNITKYCSFLNVDWFPPAEPSLKRVHIQRLICKIVERENSPAASCGEPCASYYPTSNNEIETGVEFISEGCGPLKSNENVSSSQAGQGIEITLLPKSSQCGGDSDLVFREYIEAGAPAGSFPDGQYQNFERAASFSEFKPIEDVEAGEQFVYPTSNRTGFQQLAGIGPGAFVLPYQSKDFGAETSWNQEIHQPEHEDIDASPDTSICASDDSQELAVTDKNLVGEDLVAEERIDRPGSPSAENIEFLTENLSAPSEILDVAGSQSDYILDSNGDADHPISSPKILRRLSDQVRDKQENGKVKCDDMHFIGNNPLSESDGQQVLERTGDDSVPEPDGQQVLGKTGDNSVPEPDGQKILGRTGDDTVSESVGQQILGKIGDGTFSEPDGQQILGRIDDDSVSEPDGQQILGRIGDDSASDPDEQQILGRTGDDSVLEPDGRQVLEMNGDDTVPESDGQPAKEKIGDDYLVPEPDGQQILGRSGDVTVSESDGKQIQGRIGDGTVSEPDGQQILGRIGDDSASEPDEQQILGRTGEYSVLEPDGQRVLEMNGDDTVPESDGQPAKEMIGGDLVPKADGQQTAKRVCDDSLPESDELQPAKRLRLALPLEGEID